MLNEYTTVYVDEYVGSFQFLLAINGAIVNMLLNVFWWTYEHFCWVYNDEGVLLRIIEMFSRYSQFFIISITILKCK